MVHLLDVIMKSAVRKTKILRWCIIVVATSFHSFIHTFRPFRFFKSCHCRCATSSKHTHTHELHIIFIEAASKLKQTIFHSGKSGSCSFLSWCMWWTFQITETQENYSIPSCTRHSWIAYEWTWLMKYNESVANIFLYD